MTLQGDLSWSKQSWTTFSNYTIAEEKQQFGLCHMMYMMHYNYDMKNGLEREKNIGIKKEIMFPVFFSWKI